MHFQNIFDKSMPEIGELTYFFGRKNITKVSRLENQSRTNDEVFLGHPQCSVGI